MSGQFKIPLRRLNPGEAQACFVGSGKCLINAHFEMDDGCGNPVYICGDHLQQFEELEKIIAAWAEVEIENFKRMIDEAEGR